MSGVKPTMTVAANAQRATVGRVWLVAALAFGVGALLLTAENYERRAARAARERSEEARAFAQSLVQNITNHVAVLRDEIVRALEVSVVDHAPLHRIENDALPRLLADATKCLERRSAAADGIASVLSGLLPQLEALDQRCLEAQGWAATFDATMLRFEQVRHDLLADLESLRSKVAQAEGRVRLSRTAEVRKLLKDGLAQNEAGARALFGQTDPTIRFSDLKATLGDLLLQCERVSASTAMDVLTDLEKNQIAPNVARMRRQVEGLEAADAAAGIAEGLLDTVESGIFSHAASGADGTGDGLCALAQRRATLVAESLRLRRASVQTIDGVRVTQLALTEATNDFARELQEESEHSAAQSRQTVFLVAALGAAVFLFMTSRIAGQIRRQVGLIEQAKGRIELALEAADAANRAKSAFLANMSHEIRTPMTAILGYADVLLDPGLAAKDRLESCQIIRRNGEHLLAIINDILDLSKIEAGRMIIEEIEVDPLVLLEEVFSLMQVRAAGKGLRLVNDCVFPIPKRLRSDPTRLRQILVNLVGNAIKFTESGSVTVRTRCADHPSPRLCFEVIDTGIGVDESVAANLFQPFTQADASTTRRFGGTGLGLTISRRLAIMLGGDIEVHSEFGRGSTFALWIACAPLDATNIHREGSLAVPVQAADPAPSAGVRVNARILLAEDGPDNQRLIAYHLRKAGAEVVIAENGRLAVEAVAQAQRGGRPFDLVLMDMQMPEMDGYTATALLRTRGYARTIIALTAHAMSGDREKCLHAGCTDYLTKPINRELLLEMCAACAAGRVPHPRPLEPVG